MRIPSRKRCESKKNCCYVLITCREPSEGGEMEVEMTYKGDAILASYLLQGAQSYIDQITDSEILDVTAPIPLRLVK